MTNIATCTAKRFRGDRGYGFLVRDDGPDIFLHKDVLSAAQLSPPLLGATVVVEFEEQDRGLAATRVISIEGGFDPVMAPSGLKPARVKFYNWRKGFGFARVFGVATDLHIIDAVMDGFDQSPQAGEAVAVLLDPTGEPNIHRMVPWHHAEGGDAVHGLS